MSGPSQPLPTPMYTVDQSLGGKAVERHAEVGDNLPAGVSLGNTAPRTAHPGYQSLQGDNQVGYAQTTAAPARDAKSMIPPPTPAPSANLDDQHATYSNRNRGVMTHDLSAALSKSQAGPGEPTGEHGGHVSTGAAHGSTTSAAGQDNGQTTLGAVISKGQKAIEDFTHMAQGVGEGIVDTVKGYVDVGKEKAEKVNVQKAAAQTSETAQSYGAAATQKAEELGTAATQKAQGLTAAAADNVKGVYRAVQEQVERAHIPEKLHEYEEQYTQLAKEKAGEVRDRSVEAAQYIAARAKEVRVEDLNSNAGVRLTGGILVVWLMTGIPLKWLLTLLALLAATSWLYGQVYRRRTAGHGPPPTKAIPRTGQMATVPTGEFGTIQADTGALRAAQGSAGQAPAQGVQGSAGQTAAQGNAGQRGMGETAPGVGSMVETHYPRGQEAAEAFAPPTPMHAPDEDRVQASTEATRKGLQDTAPVGGGTGYFNDKDVFYNTTEA